MEDDDLSLCKLRYSVLSGRYEVLKQKLDEAYKLLSELGLFPDQRAMVDKILLKKTK